MLFLIVLYYTNVLPSMFPRVILLHLVSLFPFCFSIHFLKSTVEVKQSLFATENIGPTPGEKLKNNEGAATKCTVTVFSRLIQGTVVSEMQCSRTLEHQLW